MSDIYEIPDSYRKRIFDGRWFYDCAVVDRNTVSFVLFDNGPEDNGNRAFGTVRFGMGSCLDGRRYTGFLFPMLGVAPNLGKTSVMLGRVSGVAVHGDAGDEKWSNIPTSPDGPVRTSPSNVATIGGRLYVCANWRHVCYLSDKREWVSIRHNLADPPSKRVTDFGFDAVSGFAENDIYAAGGEGDVWRFDGHLWRQCQIPTKLLMESICCAGDGFVYIGLQSGGLIRGRGDEWEVIHQDNMSVPFKDIVWYQDKVWCTSEYGLWTVAKDGKLVDADVPPLASACAGNLSTADGILMVAGLNGAALHDGNEWHRLV
ncbi:hypothetical protein [Roseateles depolymerans]|uniref:Uncharacterized protein n=1 Tax=Roseateles depolymerans TaxID=76731 RepID=A0A0U3L8P0_9BURK|nr:hypothetical protein [Roseateles depolymerans]ALV07678.1 hypothetical protein RD2015_3219 [Roseateles depolymerans]REG22099.1 hypothetical protein DES44_1242 [Roseateles depolymerans]